MWRNHLTVGLRSLLRDPLFTAINLFGLAIGIAGCLMIVLFIRYETSFDDWLPDAGQTYQMQRVSTWGQRSGQVSGQSPYVAATQMPGQFPEIEAATGIVYGNSVFRKDGQPLQFGNVFATDENFLKVVRLPLAQGDPATALAEVGSIVLTEDSARRLFGRTDVVGQSVTQVGGEGDRTMRVTGVIRDLPSNTHMEIDALYRPNIVSGVPGNENFTRWNWISGWVYVRLRPGADAEAMNARMQQVLRRIVPVADRDTTAPDGMGFTEALMNVRQLNTGDVDSGTMRPGTSTKSLLTFGLVAIFLLVVAGVNFTNLSTARAGRRAREVGLRKTLGATRRQLVGQFLLEGFLTVAVAGLLALALVELAMPVLNNMVDGDIEVRYFAAGGVVLPLIGILFVVGLLGGVYPAFFLSRYRPAVVLKANQSGAEAPGTGRLRTALVVLQFSVSIALIICTVIIYAQTLHARSSDPGYRVSGLLFVTNPGLIGDRSQIETFMRRVAAVPGVTSVARAGITPNPNSVSVTTYHRPGRTGSVGLQTVAIDGQTFDTLGMRIVAGRGVTEQREADLGAPLFGADPERDRLIEQRGLNVVISADAARELGFASPQAAVGQQITPETDDGNPVAPYTVVGVVNEARFESARYASLARLYFVAPTSHLSLAVRFDDADGAAVMSGIESLWKSQVNTAPFQGFFANRRIADMYREDERRGVLFAVFAGLAVLISCLGLFGLAAFTAQRRTKEIGIRKVLGARTRDIVRLLVWQFTRPVLIANLIAWPVAWWVMRNWLDEFQSRIDIGVTPFALAGLLAFGIAVATIVGHAVRVARANPIQALRYE